MVLTSVQDLLMIRRFDSASTVLQVPERHSAIRCWASTPRRSGTSHLNQLPATSCRWPILRKVQLQRGP